MESNPKEQSEEQERLKREADFLYFLDRLILNPPAEKTKRSDRSESTKTKPPKINIPEIHGIQSVKVLLKIKPHGTNQALTLVNSEIRYLPIDESDHRQLWWIIQDYHYRAFAIVNNASSKWLYYDSSEKKLYMAKADKKIGDYLKEQYFFEFETSDISQSFYLIRSKYLTSLYLQTTDLNNDESSNWRLDIGKKASENAMSFDLEVFNAFGDDFVSLPMSETNIHEQEDQEDGSIVIKTPEEDKEIPDNKAFLSSSYGFLLNRLGGKDMFKITFSSEVENFEVGLLHYKAAVFSNAFFQKEGNRKPIAGIGVKKDNKKYIIYLFNKGDIVETNFVKPSLNKEGVEEAVPIVFGYANGKLIATQSGNTVKIEGVPTPVLLNSTNGNKIRLLMKLPIGGITIGYNPKLIAFGNDFKGKDHVDFIMTNPHLSASENPEKRKNVFDWTTKTYNLRYKAYEEEVVKKNVNSPFYYGDEEEFSAIGAKYTVDENNPDKHHHIGGEDFDYYDGWELIVHDFGYDRLNNEISPSDLREVPYMILYNRYTSRLRVFVYIHNPTIANHLKISLYNDSTGVKKEYRSTRLWGSYLQGRALDDPDLSISEYSKMIDLGLATSGRFYFADFTLSYDPCIAQYQSNIRVELSAITQGDLEIVGRTQGGEIPVNSPAISDWLLNSNKYLTGILDAPYGKLKTTLGDITFRNFSRWGAQEWKNIAKFVLPGKKVKAWEKEVERLQYKGYVSVSSGEFLSSAGLLLIGAAQLATAADITNVSTKVTEGIGTLIDGAGAFTRGTGNALIAKAFRLKYHNLRDEPDKNIPITLPKPQPSVVFSELAARGTLTIETQVYGDVIITTPGSKESNETSTPNIRKSNEKGSYSLYNVPLGVFNLLYQPEIALSIVKQSKDIGGYIRLKKRPYVAVNGKIDYSSGFFMVSYVVTTYTYDSNGNLTSTESKRSKTHLLSNDGEINNNEIENVKPLPNVLDISELLDKESLLENIKGENDIENKINDWVKVDLEIEFFGYTDKNNDGTYNFANLSNTYKSIQFSSYEDVTGDKTQVNKEMSSLLINSSKKSFGDSYSGENVKLWGENYLISSAIEGYDKNIEQYCKCLKELANKTNEASSKDI